jgi:rhodanese-related sulfurtransferase
VAQAALLLALSLALAAGVNLLRPQPLPWVEDWTAKKIAAYGADGVVTLDEATAMHEAGAGLFIDARGPDAYAEAHVPGAVNLPYSEVEPPSAEAVQALPADRRLVVYCWNPACDMAEGLADHLRSQGREDVLIFPGGIEAWQGADMPVEEGR